MKKLVWELDIAAVLMDCFLIIGGAIVSANPKVESLSMGDLCRFLLGAFIPCVLLLKAYIKKAEKALSQNNLTPPGLVDGDEVETAKTPKTSKENETVKP